MCLFCDIIDGKIPNYTVYEDDYVLAFLDISQATIGHTLVIPKKHYDNFLEVDSQDLQYLITVSQKLANKLMTSLNAKGMNILSNINEIAGQSVHHFHLHLIPRYDDNDGIEIKMATNEDVNFDEVLNKINK